MEKVLRKKFHQLKEEDFVFRNSSNFGLTFKLELFYNKFLGA